MTAQALPTEFDPQQLRHAFAAFPSGVVAVAGTVEGRQVGIAASSFTSVSLEPALLSFSVAKTSSTWPVLRQAPRLGLSVLASHHDAVCRQLAGPADERFTGLPLEVTDQGAVLLDDAVTSFECTIHQEVDAGDHVLVLLALQEIHEGSGDPLVFHRSGFPRLVRRAA
jgi:flavin reductase (DIM6/NTAB) family NADH-FMN oxidoreductase RutF